MKRLIFLKNLLLAVAIMASLSSCRTLEKEQDAPADVSGFRVQRPAISKVLSAEEQNALTPDTVIRSLKEGNIRFLDNDLTVRDYSALVRDATLGQHPKAVILSCIDSRVTVEDIFDKGIGDLFVCRIAGNFANNDILGSMEYGCKVSGAKLIVVMGHDHCGAIKSAIDNVKMGNITEMLLKIKPAIEISQDFSGEKTSKNNEYLHCVTVNNIKHTMDVIKSGSPILKEMSDNGKIKIVGALYDLDTGEVTFLDPN